MHFLTYLTVRITLGLLGFLPLNLASRMGGRIGRFIGPKTRRHKVAIKNLSLVYPDKSPQWHNQTAMKMWDHLGRVLAELPAVGSGKLYERITQLKGTEHLKPEGQTIFVAAHFGQWEMLTSMAKMHGVPNVTSLYRHVNNQRLEALLRHYRRRYHDTLIRKKGDNAIPLVRALKSGDNLAMLVDQRLTKGDVLKFMGVEAPSNTVAMRLAVKTGVPLTVAFVTRTEGVDFIGEILPPIEPPKDGDEEANVQALARQVFDLFEQRIHQNPEQYLWTHDRWK